MLLKQLLPQAFSLVPFEFSRVLAQIAKLARVSRSTVQHIEGGDDGVSLATFLSYASALELGDKVIKSMLDTVCRVPVRSGQSEGTRTRIELHEEMKVS